MKLPTKTLERKLFAHGYHYVIAVDEVGMGCLAGPVVVCAVLFDKGFFKKRHNELKRVRDSKLLSAGQREVLAKELRSTSGLSFKITYAHSKTIDKLNIYQSARLAMKKSVNKLVDISLSGIGLLADDLRNQHINQFVIVLVDGRSKIGGLEIGQMAIVKGDRKVFAIACASIIAKVYRDKMMVRYAKRYPQYGFEKHKGYGTRLHQAQLAQFGPCPIHRKSFRLEY